MDQVTRSSYVYVDGKDGHDGQLQKMLSAETISAINNLYEEFKVKLGDSQGTVMDLKEVR